MNDASEVKKCRVVRDNKVCLVVLFLARILSGYIKIYVCTGSRRQCN